MNSDTAVCSKRPQFAISNSSRADVAKTPRAPGPYRNVGRETGGRACRTILSETTLARVGGYERNQRLGVPWSQMRSDKLWVKKSAINTPLQGGPDAAEDNAAFTASALARGVRSGPPERLR